ncbi:MAG: hypothetical protein E7523_06415 [Ruminococcaceae bacterium]|nr:hypothetical protein [Oscillospiraceae bacterium]
MNIPSTLKDKQLQKKLILCGAFLFFIIKTIYQISTVSWELAAPGASLYLLDYNFYYGTRTFIGSLIRLLTYNITYQQIFVLNLCVYIITAVLFFALALRTLKKAHSENNDILFFAFLITLVYPYGLIEYANWIGLYEIYLFLFSVLCCFAANKKHLYWICPFLCTAGIFTHISFAVTYFPAVMCIQFYYILTENKKAERIACFATTAAATVISAVWCVFFADGTIKMTRDELFSYMTSRLGMPVSNKIYFDTYYFTNDAASTTLSLIKSIVNTNFVLCFVFVLLPLLVLFLAVWIPFIKNGTMAHKTAGTAFIGTMLVSIAVAFIFNEFPRWFTAAALSQFLILFSLIRKEDEHLLSILRTFNGDMGQKKRGKKYAQMQKSINKRKTLLLILLVYFMIAALAVQPFYGYDPVSFLQQNSGWN